MQDIKFHKQIELEIQQYYRWTIYIYSKYAPNKRKEMHPQISKGFSNKFEGFKLKPGVPESR